MLAFIIRRLALGVLVVFGVVILTFLLARVLPTDPVSQYVGARATPEERARAASELGVDQPMYVQFGMFFGDLVRGDLGRSLRSKQPVTRELAAFLPPTLELVVAAMLMAAVIGVPMGMLSAKSKDRWPDHTSRVVSVAAIAVPSFVLGMGLQLVFFRWLHVLPLGGQLNQYYRLIDPVPHVTGFLGIDCLLAGNLGALADYLQHLILPAFTLGAGALAIMSRMTRSSMLEILNEDYITAERSYGLPERTVLWKYAFKNSIGPLATVTALTIGFLVVNTFLVEIIFDWPGIGTYIATAVVTLDYPAIIGITIFAAVTYVIVNMLADIVVAIDPRVRL